MNSNGGSQVFRDADRLGLCPTSAGTGNRNGGAVTGSSYIYALEWDIWKILAVTPMFSGRSAQWCLRSLPMMYTIPPKKSSAETRVISGPFPCGKPPFWIIVHRSTSEVVNCKWIRLCVLQSGAHITILRIGQSFAEIQVITGPFQAAAMKSAGDRKKLFAAFCSQANNSRKSRQSIPATSKRFGSTRQKIGVGVLFTPPPFATGGLAYQTNWAFSVDTYVQQMARVYWTGWHRNMYTIS